MIHDEAASVLALARSVLFGTDRQSHETRVPTASLILMLETLIDLGSPVSNHKIQDSANRAVMGQVALVEGELKSARDSWEKEADAQAALVEQGRRV